MTRWSWIRRHRTVVAAAFGLALLVAVGLGIFWLGWNWKALIGWKALVQYINPQNATDRKDAVQVYVVIVAGLVAAITAAVGLLNLRLTRRNLEQQRFLEEQRAQDDALQAYFVRMGELLTQHELKTTERDDVKGLAQALTFTLARRLDGPRKAQLVHFLYETGLIDGRKGKQPILHLPLIDLNGVLLPDAELRYAQFYMAELSGADFRGATLRFCNFGMANLSGAKFQNSDLKAVDLSGADLTDADFSGATLPGAKLTVYTLRRTSFEGADLTEATVTDRANNTVSNEQLASASTSLKAATMPNGQKYEAWRKSKGSG